MPPVHQFSFDVRFDECDAYGLINNPNLLRYMHEAGMRADQELGLSHVRREGRGWIWMAGQVEIVFLKPVYYGDTVEVAKWISGAETASWQRSYEVRRNGEEDLLVRGRVGWSKADEDSGQAQALPEPMRAALDRAHASRPEASWAVSQPSTDAMPPQALHQLRRVAWRDVDPQGRLNIAAILDYMTDVGIDAGAAHGWTLARCREDGIAFVVREHVVDYRIPAKLGEALEVSTWLSDVRRSTGLRHYRLQREHGGEVIAQGFTRWVVVRPETMRPCRLPDTFEADFAGHISV